VDTGFEDDTAVDRILSRIETTGNLREAVQGVDFVTEAVFEDLNLKREVFKEIDAATDDHVILASNTSGLNISEAGKGIRKRDRLLITHWFNPPHLIPVVEVLKTEATTDKALEWTLSFLKEMGKEPVHILKQVPGFLVNRIQTAMFREVIGLLEAGVATAENIDRAVSGSFGLRLAAIGPLATVDLAGVHLWFQGATNLYPLFDDSKKPQKTLAEMVEKGFLGKKTGKGFFDYQAGSAKGNEEEIRDKKLLGILDVLRKYKGD
jgi:3-hydroxybutyryl-CoA dehydrogenase